jgi:hypothetical protein
MGGTALVERDLHPEEAPEASFLAAQLLKDELSRQRRDRG